VNIISSHTQQFQDYLQYEKQYSVHTLKNYQRDLEQFQTWLKKNNCDAIIDADNLHIRNWIAGLHRQGIGSHTLQRKLSSLRSFYNFLIRKRQLKNNPALDIRAPKAAKKLPDTLDTDTLSQLLNIPPDSILAIRDKAIMELFYSSGLRLSELINLNVNSIDLTEKSLRAIGKGEKERLLPVGNKAIEAIQNWLKNRDEMAKQNESALFVSMRGKRISKRSIQERLNYWRKKQGLEQHILYTIKHTREHERKKTN